MNQVCKVVWAGKQSMAFRGFPVVLTQRQREVLVLLCDGLSNKLISRRLGVSDATVKTHVASVLRSLNVSTRLEAVAVAFKLGLVDSEDRVRLDRPLAPALVGIAFAEALTA